VRVVFVKICGITNESDALMAVAMGADALGFVFAPSPRQVAVPQVRDIVRRVHPEVLTVGVFRDEAPQRVVDIVNSTGLRAAQLHGHESPDEAAYVRRRVGYVIKAFAAGDPMVARAADYPVDAVLLDAAVPGSGETFDWSLANSIPRTVQLILAGGLDADNVALAIEQVAPWGVDVSTGVEYAPGHKDVRRTRWFVKEAKGGVIGDVVRLADAAFDLAGGHVDGGVLDGGVLDDGVLDDEGAPGWDEPASGERAFDGSPGPLEGASAPEEDDPVDRGDARAGGPPGP
jgi:phosphoribosylanthranilate isomerase